MKSILKSLIAMAVAGGVVVSTGHAALATPPSNDAEDGAIRVDAVPFTHSEDTTNATANGPTFCSSYASVFFTFKPSEDVHVQVDTLASEYDTALAVFTRQAGKVQEIACNDDRFGGASGIRLQAVAGTKYIIMVGRCCGNPTEQRPNRSGGPLVLTVNEVSNAPLRATLAVDDGTIDPSTGIATVSGTLTCTKRSVVYAEGLLRQVRQGLFVARGSWNAYQACTPGSPVPWSMEVDTETSVVFGPGPATWKRWYLSAAAGWNEYFEDENTATLTLQLA